MAESLTPPAAPYPFNDLDSVLIDEPAILTWTAAWFGSSPELTGKIHFDGTERCARVTLISYDASGAEMTPRDYSDIECPGDLGHQARELTEAETAA